MQLAERHIISLNHPNYLECDELCFKSKNIYNLSTYKIRQGFFVDDYNPLNNLFHEMKNEDCFKELPMKVATATTILVQKNFKSFFKAIKGYSANPSKYTGRPQLPKYLPKEDGRFITSYNYQAISKKVFQKASKIKLSGTNIEFHTKLTDFNSIACVRIVPRLDHYIIEVVYSVEDVKPLKDNHRYASIDLGVNNLATITSNTKELTPLVINGKPLKSINQFYNKKLAHYKSLVELRNKKKTSKKLRKLTNKRNNKIDNYLHKASKIVVDHLVSNNISKLVVGNNTQWKTESSLSKKTNQNFIQIPHSRFISMLSYKCELAGIKLILQEESYTSKASFLNLDNIPTYGKIETEPEFSGYRHSRGMYKLKGQSIYINADVNGSYNILRKAIPNAFADGIEGVVVHPAIIKIAN
jgi:IS605 OrfB family transposase